MLRTIYRESTLMLNGSPTIAHNQAIINTTVLGNSNGKGGMKQLPAEDSVNSEVVAIPRNQLFVLVDGTFVVRWGEKSVQELETGRYLTYERKDFGASITDYELQQLSDAGLVVQYDREQVVLCLLPESYNPAWITPWEANRTRSYYLNTALPESLLGDVVDLLDDLGVRTSFDVRTRHQFVVLWNEKGISFPKFDDAEKARLLLASKAPDAFANTVVAFVETSRR